MEALAQNHSATVKYRRVSMRHFIKDARLQGKPKISGCHGPTFGQHSVSYHQNIVMGGYALPTWSWSCPETGPTL